jgi:hypothetical protein
MDTMPSEASVVSGDQSVEELRRELAEARNEHAATAEILRIISSSPTDLQQMFAEIAASATRLCDAYDAVIRQVDGEVLRAVAHHGPIPIVSPDAWVCHRARRPRPANDSRCRCADRN